MERQGKHQFHHFIELSANRNKHAQRFPEFLYMEQTIRMNYKLVKDNKMHKEVKPSKKFMEYFKKLEKQDQIKYYEKQLNLLNSSLTIDDSYPDNEFKQGSVQIQSGLMQKWEQRQVKLENLSFFIKDKKNFKEYSLKFFAIRKSRNKQCYAWVLELINDRKDQNLKSLTCGCKNIRQYEEWYRLLQKEIEQARVDYFRSVFEGKQPVYLKKGKVKKLQKVELKKVKTLTELMVDKQMLHSSDMDQISQKMEEDQGDDLLNNQGGKNSMIEANKAQVLHPNVFARLFPKVKLDRFSQNNENMTLIESGKSYKLYEIKQDQESGQYNFRLRISITLPYNNSIVFRTLSDHNDLWNKQINKFTIKTKISSQNSALIYQKDRAQGLLYRQRDYLFLRHCFSQKAQNSNQKYKTFIADKSIDSINIPPFMKITRGQKQLIWCISGNNEDKSSELILEGWIMGGGYMNRNQNKDMSINFFKQILCLQDYLKQKSSQLENANVDSLFSQKWEVEKDQEDQFFDMPDQDNFQDVENLQQKVSQNKHEQQIIPTKIHKNSSNYTSSDNQQKDEKERQFNQFIQKSSEQNFDEEDDKVSECKSQLSFSKVFPYKPPKFKEDKTIIIPQNYLKIQHRKVPQQKKDPQYFPQYRGHHLWKGQWAISSTGGLNYVDQEKMNEQRKVLTFIIKTIGRNILSGKGILNISLPVDIFCRQSNIERLASSFGFAPNFLEKASKLTDAAEQLKYVVATANFSSLIYITMEKPFNPIIGQTYQSWIDGCPVYFQQISHHPPIASYLMIGRGYRLSGTMQAKMDLSINSGTGINEGIFKVQFDSGRKFFYTTAAGQLCGLTYGERKLLLVGKTYYWCIEEGLFLQLQFNPSSKKSRFFGGPALKGEAQLHDFVEGTLKKYKTQDLQDHLSPKKSDFRKSMAIPKSHPSAQPLSEIYKVSGRWTKYISFNGEKMFNVDQQRYYSMTDDPTPLPSHSNYRQDVVYRRLSDFVSSQEFKQVWQVLQRKDRKLRETTKKNKK